VRAQETGGGSGWKRVSETPVLAPRGDGWEGAEKIGLSMARPGVQKPNAGKGRAAAVEMTGFGVEKS